MKIQLNHKDATPTDSPVGYNEDSVVTLSFKGDRKIAFRLMDAIKKALTNE